MKTIYSLKVVCIIFTLFVSSAHAMLIEGSFRGTVNNVTQDGGLTGFWENAAVGSEVSGSFWIDTKIPSQLLPDGFQNNFYFSDNTNKWVGSSFSIDGKNYTVSDLPREPWDDLESEEIVLSFRDATTTSGWFYVNDMVGSGVYWNKDLMMVFGLSFTSDTYPLFNGWNLAQNFDWYNTSGIQAWTSAEFYITSDTQNGGGTISAQIDVSEFHLWSKELADVPEPSALILMLMGGLGLLLKSGLLDSNRTRSRAR